MRNDTPEYPESESTASVEIAKRIKSDSTKSPSTFRENEKTELNAEESSNVERLGFLFSIGAGAGCVCALIVGLVVRYRRQTRNTSESP